MTASGGLILFFLKKISVPQTLSHQNKVGCGDLFWSIRMTLEICLRLAVFIANHRLK